MKRCDYCYQESVYLEVNCIHKKKSAPEKKFEYEFCDYECMHKYQIEEILWDMEASFIKDALQEIIKLKRCYECDERLNLFPSYEIKAYGGEDDIKLFCGSCWTNREDP